MYIYQYHGRVQARQNCLNISNKKSGVNIRSLFFNVHASNRYNFPKSVRT